ncbi:MAG: hypothetical protein UT90_C0003G0002 [Parcubacteria group bacterium GW2011_GWA1_40_21]|nr:MAG: hypothetical protein UT80_C0037G0002 [Parcubacteria group bacterium GW2011_GWC1_40_13]KKR53954.1 MAG: hypothetical protein UT90_C0003G0002 [Parcubacteria group bacterium GW2011_GWA1_40_21]
MKFIKIIKNKILAASCNLSCVRKLFPKNLPPIRPPRLLSGMSGAAAYNLQPSAKGFTLIETLVAISILMVAVASPLTIAQKGLASAIYAKDQIIASYLAQDAIEYIINASDKNVADGKGWLLGISDNCGTACAVNTRIDSGIASCAGTCDALNYNESTNIYSHDSTGGDNKASPFTRTVKATEGPTDEALITVTMSWKDKGADRSLNFYTRIFNWR